MSVFQYILISLMTIAFTTLPAMPETGDAAQRLSEKLSALETFSSEFEQKLIDANGFEIQVTNGEFKAKRPGYFYWKILPPYEQVIVSNTELLWLYDPDLEQVTIQPYTTSRSSPASILSGDVSYISENYIVTEIKTGKKAAYKLDSKPSSLADFTSIEIRFKGKSLAGLQLADQLGQKTEIEFKKTKVNKKLDESIFKFVPPEGVDIISSVEN